MFELIYLDGNGKGYIKPKKAGVLLVNSTNTPIVSLSGMILNNSCTFVYCKGKLTLQIKVGQG